MKKKYIEVIFCLLSFTVTYWCCTRCGICVVFSDGVATYWQKWNDKCSLNLSIVSLGVTKSVCVSQSLIEFKVTHFILRNIAINENVKFLGTKNEEWNVNLLWTSIKLWHPQTDFVTFKETTDIFKQHYFNFYWFYAFSGVWHFFLSFWHSAIPFTKKFEGTSQYISITYFFLEKHDVFNFYWFYAVLKGGSFVFNFKNCWIQFLAPWTTNYKKNNQRCSTILIKHHSGQSWLQAYRVAVERVEKNLFAKSTFFKNLSKIYVKGDNIRWP